MASSAKTTAIFYYSEPMSIYPSLEYYIVNNHSDTPTVLLVHGFSATAHQVWVETGWVKRLISENFRLVLVRLPFHGSEFEKTPYITEHAQSLPSVETQKGAINLPDENFLKALTSALHLLIEKLKTPVHMVGFSAGSRVSQAFAQAYPHDVKTLILAGLSPFDHYQPLQKYLAQYDGDSEALPPGLNPMFLPLIKNSPVDLRGLRGFVDAMEDVETHDAHGSRSAHPTLVVVGTEDHIAGDGQWLIKQLEQAGVPHRLQLLKNRDHINSLTSGVFKKAVIGWVKEHEGKNH